MKKRLALITVIVSAVFSFAYRQTAVESKLFESSNKASQTFSEIKPQNVRAVAFGISGKVSDFAPASPGEGQTGKKSADEQTRSVPNKEPFRKQIPNAVHDSDARIADLSAVPMPTPSLSFDGLSNSDNAAAYGMRVVPPDANGDVGPNHYVQSVNILTRVFDKSGNPLTPPFKLSSIFSVLGTACSTRNDGDPIVLYDALADRWILSQFCNNFPPFRQLIAVSKTSDPTGSYYVYEFVMPNVKFNDYPKLGVWTDGYYMSTDEFLGSDYAGSGVFAFDKKKMLVGDSSASYIYFDLASPTTIRIGGLLPSDFDGLNAPPANAPNVFVGYQATEYGDPNDALRLFDFHPDFTNPNNSTFSERAESPLPVAAFDPTSPEGRADVPQPSTDERLDAQSDRLMYRAAYRNFGTHQSLVVNQTVRVSPLGQTYRGGVRVYELRKTNANFVVQEQSTFGTNDVSRWLGSAAQDYQGNLAFGYSVSGENKNPSIFYSGKLANESAGTFRQEAALVNGTGVQTAFGSRWGDYSSIAVDPTDDCTFWLTNEYYTAESQAENPFGWLTRIGRFKYNECVRAPSATITGTVTNSANGQPILGGATVTANAVYTRTTNESGSYGNLTLVPNTYTLTATARGFRSQTVTVTIVSNQTLTQNFALQPAALFENPIVNFIAESCTPNNAIDPSETVTVDIGFSNSGAGNTTNLIVTLLPTGGVVNPSQPQNYGALPSGGMNVQRPFTFMANSDLNCGDLINLTFQLQDGAENLGTVTIELNTGKPRVAFRENFGVTGEPDLPAGWTTSASGAQPIWKTSRTQHQTPPQAAYSAAAAQVGVNEMTSPAFRLNSASAELTFRNRYDLETTFLRNKLYDGSVLEIKIGEGFFQDIIAAGGRFTAGGYDGVLDSAHQNPLGGRLAWSGKSGPHQTPQFITSTVKLPARAARQNVQLRWRVGTDNGTSREGQYIDDIYVSDGYECACQTAQSNRAPFDFDGDGKTDLSLFLARLDPNIPNFAVQNSSGNSQTNTIWGAALDEPVNADYDGDGKTDYAVFRPSNNTWFVLQSSDNTLFPIIFGAANDVRVPADYDGDGRADIAVFRQAGNKVWYIRQSSDAQIRAVQFGAGGDLPAPADYDGDGKTDIAVFRPSNGTWYISQSSGGMKSVTFGQSGDRLVTGDYDADGKADFVVFRPSNGTWYLQKTAQGFSAVPFGASGDELLQADFDGDGKRDIAVYRPSNGVWYYIKSSNGAFVARQFGGNIHQALPTIYIR
jgi:hypothetical protein